MDLPLKVSKKDFASKLSEKGTNVSCLSCGKNNWAILEEAALVTQWTNRLPAPGIPVGVMICNNCGFIRAHALGALDLLPETALEDDNE